ncbi:UNVERIFIED_CONTAM: hypothetical protein NCL1_12877 [Trichonephila clavipes]
MDVDVCGKNKIAILLNKCMKKQINCKGEREREKGTHPWRPPRKCGINYAFIKIIETEKKIRMIKDVFSLYWKTKLDFSSEKL